MSINENLVLELLNDDDLIKYTHYKNGVNWKSKLSLEEYVQREWVIGVESKVCERDHENLLGVFHFALRDLTIETSTKFGNIVASCETRNRKAWYTRGNGELEYTVAPCIGSVYTLPEYRRRGYAGQMITLLNKYWDERLPENYFSFLYSEIGDYYSKFGYQSFEVPVHSVLVSNTSEKAAIPSYAYLDIDDLSSLVIQRKELLQRLILEKSKDTSDLLMSLELSENDFRWFNLRDNFIASKVHKSFESSSVGCALGKENDNDYIVWYHDWNEEHLVILFLNASSAHSFETLLSLSLEEAQKTNLRQVDLWDSSLPQNKSELYSKFLNILETKHKSYLFQPNSSVSAIRLSAGRQKRFSWQNNDKWCWF